MTEADLAWARSEFERVWPWLEKSLAIMPLVTHRKEDVWAEIESERSSLWPTANSACVFETATYPSGVKVFFGWLAGGDLREIKITASAAEAYARESGCDAFAVQGRRGWGRALDGFQNAGTNIVKDLRCPV